MPPTSLSGRSRSERSLSAAGLFLAALLAAASAQPAGPALLPQPEHIRIGTSRLMLAPDFNYACTGVADARVAAALDRMLVQWARRADIAYSGHPVAPAGAQLVVDCARVSPAVPRLGEDESYTLEITGTQAVLRAPTTTGALRGLATLTQLFATEPGRGYLPAVSIQDRPRFAWRGVLLDTVRHWLPAPLLLRELDALALVKLNVLHLHLTDDQGFRVESRSHPELHRLASDGHYYTQDELRTLVAAANARGIRVVPEFDLPGHATGWIVAHPELGATPGAPVLARRWDHVIRVLDPTNESLHVLLADFLGEMAALFPDEYVHVGGDENDGEEWGANPRIQDFIRTQGLRDNAGLQAWFNRRVDAQLQRFGRTGIVWDDSQSAGLPPGFVIDTWHNPAALAAAVRSGHPAVVSTGWYLNSGLPVAHYYAHDPVPAGLGLTPAEQALVLGGEASVWTEWIGPDNLDAYLWPAAAAVAEKLWSPPAPADAAELSARLPAVESALQAAGVAAGLPPPLRLADLESHTQMAAALRTLADTVEPAIGDLRAELLPDVGQTTSLNELADWARPEAREVRAFAAHLDDWLLADGPLSPVAAALLRERFATWVQAGELAAKYPAASTPRAQGRVRTALALADLGRLGDEAIDLLISRRPLPTGWAERARQVLDAARPNAAGVVFPFLPQLQRLAAAATDPAARAAPTRAERIQRLEAVLPASKHD